MLISRTAPILRTVCRINARKNADINLTQIRHAQLLYRCRTYPGKISHWGTEISAGIFWWWIFWFLYHEIDILRKGHIPGPIPEIFSDEELGIPPDDDD